MTFTKNYIWLLLVSGKTVPLKNFWSICSNVYTLWTPLDRYRDRGDDGRVRTTGARRREVSDDQVNDSEQRSAIDRTAVYNVTVAR